MSGGLLIDHSPQPISHGGTTMITDKILEKLPKRRPYDDVKEAGPPADPIDFPAPKIERGSRSDVLCYFPEKQQHERLQNVLFRNVSTECTNADMFCAPAEAYWPLPSKSPIKTIMGHVEICVVLKRYEATADSDIVFEPTRKRVAVKVNYSDRLNARKSAEDPLKEIAAMQLVGNTHPNILGCIEVLQDLNGNLNVVMPYCASGDLFDLIQDSTRTSPDGDEVLLGMSESDARYWFRQIMTGVKHLHSRGVCHRDLSSENVVIDGDRCMIIDMGMCLRMPYTLPHTRFGYAVTDIETGTYRRLMEPQGACGKLQCMSPEIFQNQAPFDGSAADVWTAGTILFQMLTGYGYGMPQSSDLVYEWMTTKLDELLSHWQVELSSEGYHLLLNMLQVDPRMRLSIDEVINHPWFTQHADAKPSNVPKATGG